MNIHSFDKKLHKGRLFGTLRRAVAGALTAAMLLPMVPTFGVGSQIKLQPIQDKNYRPDIEIQSNFVRDDFGFLTGYMELGLRVKTGEEPFRYLAVSLEYDTELYTPVDWSATADEIKIQNMPTDTPKLPYYYYSEELPAQKEEHINFVRAYTGIPDDPADDKEIDPTHKATLTPEVKSGRHALFSFWASATDRLTDDENDSVDGVVFKEMTTIAVVRFKVNEDEMENFTIKKNSDGTGYDIFYKEEKVTNVVKLQAEMNKPVANKWGKSVEFADDADIYVTEPDTELALEYRAGSVRLDADGKEDKVNGTLYERRYYYLPDYDASQNVKVNLVREGHTYANVDKPNYLNLLDPAVKVPSNVGDADRFSYLTNLIVDKTGSADPKDDHCYVTFPVVSERSFMAGEDILDKLTTIVYVDWDNTLLGTQIVPQNTDVRGLVSDYVAENFIYHDTDDTTYGLNDLNDPNNADAAKDAAGTDTALDIVKSLERLYNYRGKYPAGGPAADGTVDNTTVDTDPVSANTPEGSKYPLTNKLDYVFFKRPMGHDAATEPNPNNYPGGANDLQYLADKATWENTWVQPFSYDSASNAYTIEYDVERPFAYGWAKCTVDNYEDVWTTLGMGELSSYSGSADGGYQAQTAGATVTVDGEAGSQLVFADLQKGFATGERTVFLKAVYEPGVDLISSAWRYRMVEKPYYNKLNGDPANNGGAYSVDMTFERADAISDGKVHGVARIRDIVIRQDSTADLFWETNDLGGTIQNANRDEANNQKTKTSYVSVATDNGDLVEFSLTLSARFNKVDYYINDRYDINFVMGQQRTSGNNDQYPTGAPYDYSAYVLDNYNYNTADSITGDPWYDVLRYNEREGSFGFVLEGTLHSLMEAATAYNADNTYTDFYSYTPYGSMVDANLRKDASGNRITQDDEYDMQLKLLAAAAAAEANRTNADYWNQDPDKDYAELTYHQLQWFIIDGVLYDRATADSKKIKWCNLHTNCANDRTGKPTNWEEVIGAVREANGGNSTKLSSFSNLTELDELVRLRSDENGTKYTTLNDLIADLRTAVADLDGGVTGVTTIYTWDQVQDRIARGTVQPDAISHAQENYWWYDGTETVGKDSWQKLLDAAKDALTPPQTPSDDATSAVVREAKLNQMEDLFDDNAALDPNKSDEDWIKLTHNLCKDNNGTKFNSFADFKTALTGALTAGQAAGVAAPSWEQVQYYLLNPTQPFPTSPTPTGSEGYWWKDGGRRIVDLETMLDAARAKNSVWNNFTFADMDAITDGGTPAKKLLAFAADFAGLPVNASNFAPFKTRIETIATANSTTVPTWEQVQYLLIHSSTTVIDATTATTESDAYYWWKGGETTPPTMTHDTTKIKETNLLKIDISTLINAVFRVQKNGIPTANSGLDSNTIKGYRLRNSSAATGDFTDSLATESEIISNLSTLFDTLRAAGNGTEYAPPTGLTWFQVQYAILNSGAYVDTAIPTDDNYWWRLKDGLKDDLGDILKLMLDAANGTLTDSQFYTWNNNANDKGLTPTMLSGAGLKQKSGAAITTKANVLVVGRSLAALAHEIKNNHSSDTTFFDGTKFVLTAADLQAAIQKGGTNGATLFQAVVDDRASRPAGSSLLMMMRPQMAPAAPAVERTVSEDGLTETTKATIKTWNETTYNEDVTIVTETVTRVPNGETTTVITTITTVTTTIDEETGEPVTTSDTKTTVTEELAMPETPLAPLPDDPYTITPDTDVIETEKPTEPPAESTVTPEETPAAGAGDKTEPAEENKSSVGADDKADATGENVGADVPIGSSSGDATSVPGADTGGATDGPTTDPPETEEPSADPPDPGGGERTKTLALARARLRLKPLSLISIRRTKAPPPLSSIFTPNSSAGRALL